jgi:arylsulfatase A-like enzyme
MESTTKLPKMNKTFYRMVTSIIALLYCVVTLMAQSTSKPNIIFILADDLGYGDLGCYGQEKIKTPNIDKLAKGGMKFTNFYAGSTVCAPSRASLMTGRHTGHAAIRGNGEVPLPATDIILPQVLKSNGYTTGMVGKWGLGLKGTSGEPEKKGWDFFTGLLHHVEGHYQKPDSAWQLINKVSTRVKVPGHLYTNEWFTLSALNFIRQNRKQPFFLYVAYTLPHAELKVPQQYLKQYLNADGSSKFAPETEQPSGQHYGPQAYPKAAYAAMISQMDDYVGQIMELVKKLNLEKNTLIVFTSDNGTHIEGGRKKEDAMNFFKSSSALRGIKRDLYEGGIRIPFIVNWKKHVTAATTNDFPGAFWDVLPTFAELTNTKASPVDGISFMPTLLGKQQLAQHEYLYWEFYENGFKQAIRNNTWKAIRFYKGNNPERTELYDLSEDIAEQNNLALKFPGVVKEMEEIMNREHVTSDNPLFQIK